MHQIKFKICELQFGYPVCLHQLLNDQPQIPHDLDVSLLYLAHLSWGSKSSSLPPVTKLVLSGTEHLHTVVGLQPFLPQQIHIKSYLQYVFLMHLRICLFSHSYPP
jgi:hypothetical protein